MRQAQLKTSLKRNVVALENCNIFEAREQVCHEHECVTELEQCECFVLCGRVAHPARQRQGRSHHVPSNTAGTSAPSTKNFLTDVLCCNTRAHEARSPADALPRTNETLREEIVRITCTRARHSNKCRCVRDLKKFDAPLAPCVARHQTACQNFADGGL